MRVPLRDRSGCTIGRAVRRFPVCTILNSNSVVNPSLLSALILRKQYRMSQIECIHCNSVISLSKLLH